MKIHPSQEQLIQYCEGTLSDVDGFTIALHLEQCSECKAKARELEAQCANLLFGAEVDSGSHTNDSTVMNEMLDAITALESSTQIQQDVYQVKHAIIRTPNGKEFVLPKALSRHVERIGDWKNYGGKVYSASVDLDTQARVNLLYINEDAQVPQHTHKGEETTVILHGGFSDEDGHYHAGDYLTRDASHKHAPFTQAGEDCLCLTVLTEPMIFTQGVARIFNLFGKGMYP
ncbi:ChrR family anti-sigma-E factor [Vibrio agarivorans]|uniref:ChrR family anti-sigma-E factor n=1 Tax=Vibrio agarivorans TaxID=153622 RepID=A0ABT7Y1F3_9VIBR|nr:ChrR family anti-sigma-E factor [Vibrio agarivorans]MDN2481868.1 ChrR family anti-sigma-E factor [Vibrio agarivorans]